MLFNIVLKGHVVRSLHQISIAYLELSECMQNLRSKFQYKAVVFLFLSDGKINVNPSENCAFYGWSSSRKHGLSFFKLPSVRADDSEHSTPHN
jgi:hypothetical protein